MSGRTLSGAGIRISALERKSRKRLDPRESPALLLDGGKIPLGSIASKVTSDRFQVTNDPLGTFVARRCVLDPSRKSEKQALRDRYIDFLKTYGLPEPLGEMFFRMLYDRFPAVKEGGRTTINGVRQHMVTGIEPKDAN